MKRAIRKTVTYDHPPARVWEALTRADALAAWLMPNDFEPRVGHRFTFRTDPAPGFDGIVHCEVLALDPPARMVWSWRGGNIDTVVTFELEPAGRGTRLRFEQRGFEGVGPILTSLILQAGFGSMVRALLPRVLARLARGEDPAGREPAAGDEGDGPAGLGARIERAVARVAARLGRGEGR